MRAGLEDALATAGVPAQVTGEATVFQPWFSEEAVVDHRSALRADPRKNLRFIDLLLDRGIVKGHEKFFVSAAHSDEDIDYTIEALGSAAAEFASDSRIVSSDCHPRVGALGSSPFENRVPRASWWTEIELAA